jgi:hypothetical protein
LHRNDQHGCASGACKDREDAGICDKTRVRVTGTGSRISFEKFSGQDRMTEQETIIPETTGQRIVKALKKQSRSRKTLVAAGLLFIVLIAGYSVGYNSGYHQALVDFEIIVGRVMVL